MKTKAPCVDCHVQCRNCVLRDAVECSKVPNCVWKQLCKEVPQLQMSMSQSPLEKRLKPRTKACRREPVCRRRLGGCVTRKLQKSSVEDEPDEEVWAWRKREARVGELRQPVCTSCRRASGVRVNHVKGECTSRCIHKS